MSHEAILIVRDGESNTDTPLTFDSGHVAAPSTLLTTNVQSTLGGELRSFYSGVDRGDLAMKLLCAVRQPQIARPFEQHLMMITDMTVEQFLQREGADPRIREAVSNGDELVRSRYVFQLLYRYYTHGIECLLQRDSHIMCTVALGGGDDHLFQHSASVLREALMKSPALSHLLGLPKMLGHSEPVEEDTAKYFEFVHEPLWRKLLRSVTGL